MTLKTSLFNKGIYKSTVRRFTWGSVLYFIMLFMSTSFVLLAETSNYIKTYYANPKCPLILRQEFFTLPLLMAAVVPTVVALLVFRFVHSKKQSVFIHSLPVSRTANYISSILAAFTLMAIPVVLNGIILMIISAAEYSKLFSIASCFTWIGINLLVLFIMFAYAAFSAVITGNTVAAIVLNALLHSFLLIITAGFSSLAAVFFYGFDNQNIVLDFLLKNLPLTWIFNSFLRMEHSSMQLFFRAGLMLAQLGMAAVFYALAYLLYRLRRLETAEDIAGFRCLNPIFKYLATALAAFAAFGIFGQTLSETRLVAPVVVIVATVIVYFSCEMLLKKTLRVWHAYKGYLCFAAVSAVVLYAFAFTGFFGYESFVPDISDVESITAYEYYYGRSEPWVTDAAVKKIVTERHKMLTEQAHTLNCWMDIEDGRFFDRSYLTIGYKMNNGDVIKRRYPIAYDDKRAVLGELYVSDEYKKALQEMFSDDISDVVKITLVNSYGGREEAELDSNSSKELFECIKTDEMSFGYDEAVIDYGACPSIQANIEYISKEAEKEAAEDAVYESESEREEARVRYIYRGINGNHKNTIEWLKKNGYGDMLKISSAKNVYIYKNAESRQSDIAAAADGFSAPDAIEVSYSEIPRTTQGNSAPTDFDSENYIRLNEEDKAAILEYAFTAHVHDMSSTAYYNLYYSTGDEAAENDCQILMSVAEDEIPEFLKKYID